MTERSTTAGLLQWETGKPYGSKMTVLDTPTETILYIVIEPHKHTGMGIDPQKLDGNGLRFHPDEELEHVRFVRYADGGPDDGICSLVYRVMERGGQKEYRFGIKVMEIDGEKRPYIYEGQGFDSIKNPTTNGGETGDPHILINDSDRPVLLEIRAKKRTAAKTLNDEIAELNVRYEDLEALVYRRFLEKHEDGLQLIIVRKILALDAGYMGKLAELDKEQRAAMSNRGRGISPLAIVHGFEDAIMKASDAHAESVKSAIKEGADPSKVDGMLSDYQKECVEYFNPENGMLSRYYAELHEILKRHGMAQE